MGAIFKDKWTLLLAIGACICVMGVGSIYSKRLEYAPGVVSDYDTVYAPAEVPRITALDLGKGSLSVEIQGMDARGELRSERVPFALNEGRHDYSVAVSDFVYPSAVTARIAYRPPGPKSGPELMLIESNVPLAERGEAIPLAKWCDGYWEDDDPQRIERAKARLAEQGVVASQSTLERLARVGTFVTEAITPHRGTPTAAMDRLSGLASFESALAGESEVWCFNISKIFAAYANLAGVPTRVVHILRARDGVKLTSHTFCESFVAEQGRWAFVDLTSGQTHATRPDGGVLNAWELFESWQTDRLHGVTFHYALADAEEHGIFNFESFFHRHSHFHYTYARHQSGSKVAKGVAHFFAPKHILALNPGSLVRYRQYQSHLLMAGVALGLAALVAGARARGRRAAALSRPSP